jgi:hypothetical protein
VHTSPLAIRASGLLCLSLSLIVCTATPALAQTANDDAEIRKEIEALRAEHEHIVELERQNEASLRALEARVGITAPAPSGAPPVAAAPPAATPATAAAAAESRWKFGGDVRVRAQSDWMEGADNERKSTQYRGRFGATFAASDSVLIGARVVTGDPDDPNSADVQLSNWDDDLQVALDLAYAQFNFGDLKFFGGKIPQPFTRTDLVWDGDVNPQGGSAVYRHPLQNGSAFRANAEFFIIDERAVGTDSTMAGLQLGYDSAGHGAFKFDLSAGYYDYNLDNIAGGDTGDFRSNQRNPDGSYVSDFDLVDVVGGLTWQGANAKWPLRVVGDYVKNLGADTGTDTGYGADIIFGRASQPGDWRFTYGYSQTDVDAVLAAFSHDNIAIATNYQLHALTVDYTPIPKATITGIWYRYSPNDPDFAGALSATDWLDRFRLFFQVAF